MEEIEANLKKISTKETNLKKGYLIKTFGMSTAIVT